MGADSSTGQRGERLVLDNSPADPYFFPPQHTQPEPALSNVPDNFQYTQDHEYVKKTDDASVVIVGIKIGRASCRERV